MSSILTKTITYKDYEIETHKDKNCGFYVWITDNLNKNNYLNIGFYSSELSAINAAKRKIRLAENRELS